MIRTRRLLTDYCETFKKVRSEKYHLRRVRELKAFAQAAQATGITFEYGGWNYGSYAGIRTRHQATSAAALEKSMRKLWRKNKPYRPNRPQKSQAW